MAYARGRKPGQMTSQRPHLKAGRQGEREKDTTHPFLLPLFAQVQSHAKNTHEHTPIHVHVCSNTDTHTC